MERYIIEYQDVIIFNSDKPLGVEHLEISADSFSKAALKAIPKLIDTSNHMDVYNATIVDSNGRRYEILKKGSWLIDTDTGKRLEEIASSI